MTWTRWLKLRIKSFFCDLSQVHTLHGPYRVSGTDGMSLRVYRHDPTREFPIERVLTAQEVLDADHFAMVWLSRNGWKCPRWSDGSVYDF